MGLSFSRSVSQSVSQGWCLMVVGIHNKRNHSSMIRHIILGASKIVTTTSMRPHVKADRSSGLAVLNRLLTYCTSTHNAQRSTAQHSTAQNGDIDAGRVAVAVAVALACSGAHNPSIRVSSRRRRLARPVTNRRARHSWPLVRRTTCTIPDSIAPAIKSKPLHLPSANQAAFHTLRYLHSPSWIRQ